MRARVVAAFLLLFALPFGAAAQSLPDFSQLEAKLGIRPDQKQQFDKAVDATKEALIAAGIAAVHVKDAISKEMDKKNPDYVGLVIAERALLEKQKPLFEESGRQWERVFKQLDDRQLKIAKDWLHENIGRI